MNWFERMMHLVRPRNREEIKDLAGHAMRWMADDTLNTALARMRFDLIETWRTSKDPTTRERAWIALQELDGFVGQLAKMLADEDIAKDQETRAERTRAAGL